jgi:hypothetical protein
MRDEFLSDPLSEEQAADGDFVQSLERGLSVIRAFDADHARLSLSEVAAATGMSRAALGCGPPPHGGGGASPPPLPAYPGPSRLHAQR